MANSLGVFGHRRDLIAEVPQTSLAASVGILPHRTSRCRSLGRAAGKRKWCVRADQGLKGPLPDGAPIWSLASGNVSDGVNGEPNAEPR